MTLKNRVICVTPLICLIIFLTIGFVWDIWHPTWAVFFAILIVPILLNADFSRIIYPLACAVAFVVIGLVWNYWHPGWIIFLTIPVYYTLFEPYFIKQRKKVEVIVDKN